MDPPGESDQEDCSSPIERGGDTSSLPSPPLLPNPPRNNDLAFPMRLHEMIQWVERKYPHSSRPISWLSSGRAFAIRDHDALVTTILPQFFNQLKIESFARKLNRWGFSIIRSGSEKGGYMHKDFVRWEEPLSITSMSKDRRRKRKSTSSKANSPPKNESTSQMLLDEDNRKMPARNEDDAKNDLFLRERTLEAVDPSAQYQRQQSSPRCNQAFENDKKMPPRSHGNSNPNNAIPGGGSIRQLTNEHISWNEGLFSCNQTESFLDTDNLRIQGGEQGFQLKEAIRLNRTSAFPQCIENQNSTSRHAQSFVAQQQTNFPPEQTEQVITMTSEHARRATENTDTNATLTIFNDATTTYINSMTMPTALLTNNSTIHGIEARNVSDFTNNAIDIYHYSNAASTNSYQAFENHQPINFPPAQPGQFNSMISCNANSSAENFSNNIMPRSHDGMMAISNDTMISFDTHRNAAIYGFGTTDVGNINFPTNSNNMNVAGASYVYQEDFLSPLAIFSPNFDRDVAKGRISFTTAAAARNEDCKEDTKGTSTNRATEGLDEDQIDRDLRDYFQQLEKSISNEKRRKRRL